MTDSFLFRLITKATAVWLSFPIWISVIAIIELPGSWWGIALKILAGLFLINWVKVLFSSYWMNLPEPLTGFGQWVLLNSIPFTAGWVFVPHWFGFFCFLVTLIGLGFMFEKIARFQEQWKSEWEKEDEMLRKVKEMPNSQESLIEKAHFASSKILEKAAENVAYLLEGLGVDTTHENDPERWGELFYETVLFYLHMFDRFSSEALRIDMKKQFMDVLMDDVIREISNNLSAESDTSKFSAHFRSVFALRHNDYSTYSDTEWRENSVSEGLFGTFGGKLSELLGVEVNEVGVAVFRVRVTALSLVEEVVGSKESE